MRRIYLDYAATTPVNTEVLAAMQPYFAEKFGNPGSLHSFGQETIASVDESRDTVAKAIGADFREIIFTGSATEANNLTLRGALKGTLNKENGVDFIPRIIVSTIEHESILETARDLEKGGIEVIFLPVDKRGTVDLNALSSTLNKHTVLVSVMYANNEIGTIQPISEIIKIINTFKAEQNSATYPLFHTDAVQAFQFLDCDTSKSGVDLMTLSAHKMYGPKGIGALYVRDGVKLKPVITGGGHEFGLRSGTENVPLIVGFAKAIELVSNSRELETKRIGELRDYFWVELEKIFSKAELNSNSDGLPNIINVYFPGKKAEELLTKFDLAGLAVSSNSACRSRATKSSYVIGALGHQQERAEGSIRFSFGRPTTKEEVDKALDIIKNSL